jgi:predicted nucleic acid-binding protein
MIEGMPWEDAQRAWELSQASLRYADAVFVAAGSTSSLRWRG